MTSSLLAASTALAPGLVGRVADQPITKVEFDHWAAIYDHSEGAEPTERVEEVITALVEFYWVDREAKRLRITTSEALLDRAVKEVLSEDFNDADSFEDFARKTGATVEDLRRSVRHELLLEELHDRWGDGEDAKKRDFRRAVREYRRFTVRYRGMTACGTGYYVKDVCVKEVPLSA